MSSWMDPIRDWPGCEGSVEYTAWSLKNLCALVFNLEPARSGIPPGAWAFFCQRTFSPVCSPEMPAPREHLVVFASGTGIPIYRYFRFSVSK